MLPLAGCLKSASSGWCWTRCLRPAMAIKHLFILEEPCQPCSTCASLRYFWYLLVFKLT